MPATSSNFGGVAVCFDPCCDLHRASGETRRIPGSILSIEKERKSCGKESNTLRQSRRTFFMGKKDRNAKAPTSERGNLSAQPRLHQRAAEIQDYGTVSHMLPLDLEEPVRLEMTE